MPFQKLSPGVSSHSIREAVGANARQLESYGCWWLRGERREKRKRHAASALPSLPLSCLVCNSMHTLYTVFFYAGTQEAVLMYSVRVTPFVVFSLPLFKIEA